MENDTSPFWDSANPIPRTTEGFEGTGEGSLSSQDLTDQEQEAWRRFVRTSAVTVDLVDHDLMQEHSVGLSDYDVLLHLSRAEDHSLRMTELAKEVMLSPSGLTRRLDGLVKKGLVERRPCPTDGRGLLAVLTGDGLDKAREMAPTHMRGVREHFVARLHEQDLKALTEILEPLGTP